MIGYEQGVGCDTPKKILLSQFESELVHRAIDNLPIHYRETILLCEMEEMSYREIAEILSIPVGTVMSRLARARRFIREFMLNTLAPRSQPQPDINRLNRFPLQPKGTCEKLP